MCQSSTMKRLTRMKNWRWPCTSSTRTLCGMTSLAIRSEETNCKIAREIVGANGLDSFAYTQLLQDIVEQHSLMEGKAIHGHVMKRGGCVDLFAWNTFINMYCKCGSLADAHRVFDEITMRNTVSWVALIQGHLQNENFMEAWLLFVKLTRQGYELNAFAFTTVLKVLVNLEFVEAGSCIHGLIIRLAFDDHTFVGSALIELYSECGCIQEARKVFDGIVEKDLVLWTGMIDAYAQNACSEQAFGLFCQMRNVGLKPNPFTFSALIKACACLEDEGLGRSIHGFVIKKKLDSDFFVGSALLDMYAACGELRDARLVFEMLPHSSVVIWSYMIARSAQFSESKEALMLFQRMQQALVPANQFTYSSVLQACSSMASLALGKQVHCHIQKTGYDSSIFASNALMDVYVKCGEMEDALRVFGNLHHKNDVSWNTIIVGYAQLGHSEGALKFFHKMLGFCVQVTDVTLSSTLCACASLAALEIGIQIHSLAVKTVYDRDVVVGNALIDMYAKCGNIKDAHKVFDLMNEHDIISWNALITGYSLHGLGLDALKLFDTMLADDLQPNSVTFVGVLSACSNAGLVKHGLSYFQSMAKEHLIVPGMEHYTCIVMLLGRSGCLREAMEFIRDMPMKPDVMVWRAMLGACVIYNNLEFGKVSAQHVLELEPLDHSTYVLVSNMCAAAGRWKDVAGIRKFMREKGLKKEPGLSWIEIQGRVHSFAMGDLSHPQIMEIKETLEWLKEKLHRAGYVPDRNVILHDVGEDQKEQLLWLHSERLAIALGFINLPTGSPIRIIKNLRVCSDCHAAIKYISKVVDREIIVRDMNRFHHFKNGICSCGDYW
ncbi:putative pentatricopeptide repeat-containing protein At5g13230, mitochondrial isoform X2 [Nymphaea colorata]|nr:putative pentatricopeptide repeat-containing protein At5g13230, mitochondrial isoform X2 [Nymphaea colorata]